MKPVHITKHARKRIEKGDQFGLRTELTPEEVAKLIHDKHALKDGRVVLIYSETDDKTYEVVTARQKGTIVTMYDTRRHANRVIDMVMRARAGASFEFSEPPSLLPYQEDFASEVYLGTYKDRGDELRIKEVMDVGHLFGYFQDEPGVLESRHLHDLIVSSTMSAQEAGLLSKTQAKKLHFFIHDQRNRQIAVLPVWISFTLLDQPYIGTPSSL